MRIDKFTHKAQEAIQQAQHLAGEYNHPNIEPVHLLKALIEQPDGVVPSMLRRIGVDVSLLSQSIDQELAKMPRATGSSMQVGLSRQLTEILQEAENIAAAMKDQYTSTEHLLMAMAQPKAGDRKSVV